MAHEKYRNLLTETDLLAGKFERIIKMLDSGEELPVYVRRALSNMLKSGTLEETGTGLKLVIKRRDGKLGAPKKTIEELMHKVDLGRRVIELFDDPGSFEAAVITAAKEHGVSERTAKAAYSFVKSRHEEMAIEEDAKKKQHGLLNNVRGK